MSPHLLLTALLFPLLTLCTTLSFQPPAGLLPTLPASTAAHLTTLGQSRSTPLTLSGHFTFRNLTAGSYLLTVTSTPYIFTPLRVDVLPSGETEVFQTKHGIEWANKGIELKARPVEIAVVAKKEYYTKREGFSPLSLLKNPMILLAVVSIGIMFGMPYLLENMDPEMKAEFEEQRKKSPLTAGSQNSLQNFDMAAWMAGSGGSKEKPKESADTGRGSSGGRRR